MSNLKPVEFIRFNHLTIIKDLGMVDKGCTKKVRRVKARCICGSVKSYDYRTLKSEGTISCGCIRRKKSPAEKPRIKHGLVGSPIYRLWNGIKNRCLNPNSKDFDCYGGRGITICDEWKDDAKAFYDWCINNGWEKGLQIDRIENDDDYRPGNCRFITGKENCRNQRRNRMIEYNGKIQSVSTWAEELGCSRSALCRRLNTWPVEKALTRPIGTIIDDEKWENEYNKVHRERKEAAIELSNKGLSRKEIAENLNLNIHTIYGYLK